MLSRSINGQGFRFTLYPLPFVFTLSSSFYYETIVSFIHSLVRFHHAVDAGAPRALGKLALELFERRRVTDGIELHVTVPEVFHIPVDAELAGPPVGKIPVTDTLYPAANHKLPGDFRRALGHKDKG